MSQSTLYQLNRISDQEVYAVIEKLKDYELKAAQAEVEYKRAKAIAFVKTQGAEGFRKATADIESGAELLALRAAEADVTAQKHRVQAILKRIDAVRTIASTERILDVGP